MTIFFDSVVITDNLIFSFSTMDESGRKRTKVGSFIHFRSFLAESGRNSVVLTVSFRV